MNPQHDNPKAYEKIYAGKPQVKKEDKEFVRLVGDIIDFNTDLVDLGCGTGLCLQLLEDNLKGYYFGVDLSKQMVAECRARYADNQYASFVQDDCYRFMVQLAEGGKVYPKSCVSLYALDLMNADIVRLISKTFTGGCAFLVFNEPWKPGSASIWAGKEAEYNKLARSNSELVRRELCRYGFTFARFCNEDYYYLVTRKKQGVYRG